MITNKPILIPCSLAWDDLSGTSTERYCGTCNKTIIDFSCMSEEELIAYLQQSKVTVCGSVNPTQVTVALVIKADWRYQSFFKKSLLFVGVGLFSTLLMAKTQFRKLADASIFNNQIIKSDSTISDSIKVISGIVVDSSNQKPLDFVTIVVFHFDQFVGATYSEADGSFKVAVKIPSRLIQEYRIEIINTGYDSLVVPLCKDNLNNIKYKLHHKKNSLKNVVLYYGNIKQVGTYSSERKTER